MPSPDESARHVHDSALSKIDMKQPLLTPPSTESLVSVTRPYQERLIKAGLILGWGVANISLLMSNRMLLSHASFGRPVLLTLLHMLVSTALSFTFTVKQTVTARQSLCIAGLAVVFATSIVAGNLGLSLVHVSFFQAIGATTPAFVAVLSFLLMGQREPWKVVFSLCPIMIGLVIATGAEPSFHLLGFAACLTATVMRALKTVLQGVLLKKCEPMAILKHMSLYATALLFVSTVVLERDSFKTMPAVRDNRWFYAGLLTNCSLAMASNYLSIRVTQATGPLTMQVCGNCLGIVGTVVSVIIFRNTISFGGMLGYGITLGGIAAYVAAKNQSNQDPHSFVLRQAQLEQPRV